MLFRSSIPLAVGVALVVVLALLGARLNGDEFARRLSVQAQAAIARTGGKGVTARFRSGRGWATRHATLTGGEKLDDTTRARTARAVAAIPGVGGVRWFDGSALASGTAQAPLPAHCQDDVEALLRARTIRFEESSATIDETSTGLIGEVADALRPCLGAIIAITGHTDSSGPEPGNLALSQERAEAVRDALIALGIPADGLRALGVGSAQPVAGLDPGDPANRRIDFSVIQAMPVKPTPVDTPGAH